MFDLVKNNKRENISNKEQKTTKVTDEKKMIFLNPLSLSQIVDVQTVEDALEVSEPF
jgi:hypothetical protein